MKSVVYDTPYTRATQYSIDTVVDLYRLEPSPKLSVIDHNDNQTFRGVFVFVFVIAGQTWRCIATVGCRDSIANVVLSIDPTPPT